MGNQKKKIRAAKDTTNLWLQKLYVYSLIWQQTPIIYVFTQAWSVGLQIKVICIHVD